MWSVAERKGDDVRDAYCGIDVGTQGVRAVVVSSSGAVLGNGRASLTAAAAALDGRHEQDPAGWWEALVAAVSAALDAAGFPRIAAVALDATSGTVLVEQPDGTPRGPALMYNDARAADQGRRAADVGRRQWAAMGYRMQPTWALPKAMWLVETGAVHAGDRIVHQADHLARRLAGRPVATDVSTALKTGADLVDVTWPAAVLTELGVDPALLPPLVLPGTPLARVSREAAAATGLTHGAVIRAGMTDGCAAQIAAGALRPGQWSSALGTTLVVKGASSTLVHDDAGAVYCHRHPDGGWLPGGASNSGTGVFASYLAGADLDALSAAAAALPLPAGVSYPLAGRGERFPFVSDDAAGFVTHAATDEPARFAALCLSIALVERLAYDVLAALGADTTGTVALTGGATRNTWLNQLRCDALGRPAVLPASAEAAVGMAILAAAEPGALTATADAMVRLVQRLEPDADRHVELSGRYHDLVADLADRGWLPRGLAQAVLAAGAAA